MIGDRDAREEVGRQREVVEHRHDRRPVAAVEVGQQFHDLDLVADVEVGGGFVEDEDRCGLRHGHGDEDELSLAHGQLAHVPSGEVRRSDSLHRAGDRRAVRRTQPGEWRLVGQPPERDHFVDRHLERELHELRHDGDGPGDGRARDGRDRRAA